MMRALMRASMLASMLALSLTLGLSLVPAHADEALDARLKLLETQLRCLVCQNQTLADSNAPLAEDLRKEVRELAVAGKDDAAIKRYLVARYGDFVLYRPPLKPTTWLLWLGPFLMLIGGALVWWVVLRRRARGAARAAAHSALSAHSANSAQPSSEASLARARSLLS